MSSVIDRKVSSPARLYEQDHRPGDVVIVERAGHSYYGRVLCGMANGGYLVDPIAFGDRGESPAATR